MSAQPMIQTGRYLYPDSVIEKTVFIKNKNNLLTLKKIKIMKKKFFLPSTDEGIMTWLANFAVKLSNHAAALGISAETLTSVKNDSNMFTYIVNLVNSFRTGLSQRVSYKILLKKGPEGTPAGGVPVFNIYEPPAVVEAGILVRVRRLVQNIKSNDNYNESIGNDLGIIGPAQEEIIHDLKPVLRIKSVAGKPVLTWKKGVSDSLEIYVDRGDGKSFVYLGNSSKPRFADTSGLDPSAGTAEWKYKAIFRIKDEHVGQYSDVISTTVKKEIA